MHVRSTVAILLAVLLLLLLLVAGWRWKEKRRLNSLFDGGSKSRSMSTATRPAFDNPTYHDAPPPANAPAPVYHSTKPGGGGSFGLSETKETEQPMYQVMEDTPRAPEGGVYSVLQKGGQASQEQYGHLGTFSAST